jgi:hypothetical protein
MRAKMLDKVAQYSPGIHRRQLARIAKQNQTRRGR